MAVKESDVFIPMMLGTCRAAGFSSCCTSGECQGSPATCRCDRLCERFRDCCPDATSLCDEGTVASIKPSASL